MKSINLLTMKVTIEHYIATNNPNEAQAVLSKYGVRVKNMPDMIRKMHMVMKQYGEKAVRDFAAINTPYKSLLLSTLPAAVPSSAVETKSSACGCSSSADGEESSNACGCSGADGEEMSGCDGKKCNCACGKNAAKAVSNVEGDKKESTPEPTETAKAETKEEKTEASKPAKETPAPTKAEKEKTDMMPFVIVGAVALIAVVVIAKS